ncbi:MAG: alpha-hydroxy-acid oxidizing protein [Thaumarchaeota archaeon]|nr:alpha-hydroxy-acid oxidizing protein [Nitrososphaerota archaeon]
MVGKELPVSYEGWEELARKTLNEERFRYIAAGTGYDETISANLEAFRKWKIVPRVLRDVGNRSSAVTLLGTIASAPLLLAPVRALGYIHHDGDMGVARAAADLGVPLVVSTFATTPIEKIAEAMGNASRWFQLYPGTDPEIMKSLVHRAEVSGYSAIVVTVDKADNYPQYSGPRGHEYDLTGYEVYFSDPVFGAKFGGRPERQFEEALKLWKEVRLGPGLSLDDLLMLTKQTRLPVIPKGILDARDAALAVENGAAGIIVSNHGGRSLDGEVASLDALLEVRKVVGKEFPVLLDSGVRSGTDMVKALALGANAVLVGKAYLFGLGVAGELGVRKVLRRLIREFDSAMGLCGALTVGDIDRSAVVSA